MPRSLSGRSFLKLLDFSTEEIQYLLELAKDFKRMKRAGTPHKYLAGKNIVLLFEKTSTRTRCSFEVAGNDLGMGVTYLDPGSSQMGKKESLEDTAKVLGRMFDGIEYRGFDQQIVEDLAKHAGVPVWNGLTDDYHPTQILADLLTVKEAFGSLANTTVAYVGDGRNNVANSLMMGCAKAGVNYVCCTPKQLWPEEEKLAEAAAVARRNGVDVKVFDDPKKGVKGANVLYTDVWVSMGEEAKTAERIKLLRPYQINMELMSATGNMDGRLVFLHCLPAFHDFNTEVTKDCGALEVTDEVFESKYSRVFDESENRMHTIKALFVSALCDRAAL